MESLTSVDKSRIKHAFQKALNSYDEHALIQQKMNIKLMMHLQDYLPNGSLDSVLELGCGSGMLSTLLQNRFQPIIGYLMICAMCILYSLKN